MSDDARTPAATPVYGIQPPSYRLPVETQVGRVRLQVANLARSIAYYEQILGLRVRSTGNDTAILTAHGDGGPLIELHEQPGARPVPRRGRLGLYHFAILLPDRSALGRFLAHLANVGVAPGMSDHTVSEALYLTDSDGLGIEVYADRPRTEWRHDSRQLVMGTEPLNVNAVLEAAGGKPWTGMPAGTTMGHIHLHVGDLTAAQQFYHAALGFDLTVWGYPGALFLSAGGYHHHLGTNTWAAGIDRPTEHDAQLLDWELILPTHQDAFDVQTSLTNAGHPVSAHDDGTWLTRDPWGTAIRLRALG